VIATGADRARFARGGPGSGPAASKAPTGAFFHAFGQVADAQREPVGAGKQNAPRGRGVRAGAAAGAAASDRDRAAPRPQAAA